MAVASWLLGGLTLLLSGAVTVRAEPPRCSLELVLAVDTSGSVDHREYRLQTRGFARAFRDPSVIAAIKSASGGVAVTMVHWSSVDQQRQVLDWALLVDEVSAHAFAADIAVIARSYTKHGTALGHALRFSADLIASNRFACHRRVIDVSGDGQHNVGFAPAPIRDIVTASGITINGIAILSEEPQLDAYYRSDVIGGAGAFVITAEEYEGFEEAIRIKLLREISPRLTFKNGSLRTSIR